MATSCLSSAWTHTSRAGLCLGNFFTLPLKPTGAALSKANSRGITHTHVRRNLSAPHMSFPLEFLPHLVTPQLLWYLFLQMWPRLSSLLPPAREPLAMSSGGPRSRGSAQFLETLGPEAAPTLTNRPPLFFVPL